MSIKDIKIGWEFTPNDSEKFVPVSGRKQVNIAKRRIDVPTLNKNSFSYTGNKITPSVTGYDGTKMTMSGDIHSIDAGDYVVSFELTDPTRYKWNDDSTEPKTVEWNIKLLSITVAYTTIKEQQMKI